jgi:CDGSH-type Zn-finger protein/uncharacterized Fe-S cluster protein YjdI
MSRVHKYRSVNILVTWDAGRCLHIAECLSGLPAVFDTRRAPWIQPDRAPADTVAEIVERCPTGALHYERFDGGPAEIPDSRNVVLVAADGPLYAWGDLEIVTSQGTILLHDTRVALCRCGASQTKPFCDNSHWDIAFTAAGALRSNEVEKTGAPAADHRLRIMLTENGPLELNGSFELASEENDATFSGNRARLCRCGGSQNEPYCDETHRTNHFKSA